MSVQKHIQMWKPSSHQAFTLPLRTSENSFMKKLKFVLKCSQFPFSSEPFWPSQVKLQFKLETDVDFTFYVCSYHFKFVPTNNCKSEINSTNVPHSNALIHLAFVLFHCAENHTKAVLIMCSADCWAQIKLFVDFIWKLLSLTKVTWLWSTSKKPVTLHLLRR